MTEVATQALGAGLHDRRHQIFLRSEVAVEGVAGETGPVHDVGHGRALGGPALAHDLQAGVEKTADLVGIHGLAAGQGPLGGTGDNRLVGGVWCDASGWAGTSPGRSSPGRAGHARPLVFWFIQLAF